MSCCSQDEAWCGDYLSLPPVDPNLDIYIYELRRIVGFIHNEVWQPDIYILQNTCQFMYMDYKTHNIPKTVLSNEFYI